MAETRLRSTRCNHRLIVADDQGVEKLSKTLSAVFPGWLCLPIVAEETENGGLAVEVKVGGRMPFDGISLDDAGETVKRLLEPCLPGSFVEVFDPDGCRFGKFARFESGVEERWCDARNPFEDGALALNGEVLPAEALEMIEARLEANGLEIIDEAWRDPATGDVIGMVAKDDCLGKEEVVFIQVLCSKTLLPREDIESARTALETAAAAWLARNFEMAANTHIRFDVVSVALLGEHRALVRHCVNAIGL